ncbi:hypothetical protein BC835DRAFT_1311060 [Cytidiella melzeri]|nr:hypothetical protein BC835DRAFT_1311060 [Cytidiella melzeri]
MQREEPLDASTTPIASGSSNANGKQPYNAAFHKDSDVAGGSIRPHSETSAPADKATCGFQSPTQDLVHDSNDPAPSPGMDLYGPATRGGNRFPFTVTPDKELRTNSNVAGNCQHIADPGSLGDIAACHPEDELLDVDMGSAASDSENHDLDANEPTVVHLEDLKITQEFIEALQVATLDAADNHHPDFIHCLGNPPQEELRVDNATLRFSLEMYLHNTSEDSYNHI